LWGALGSLGCFPTVMLGHHGTDAGSTDTTLATGAGTDTGTASEDDGVASEGGSGGTRPTDGVSGEDSATDGGTSVGDSESDDVCAALSDEMPCLACGSVLCCDEIIFCDAQTECMCFLECLEVSTPSECQAQCDAVSGVAAVMTCLAMECAGDCMGE
jgi:hypothetical protein